MALNKELMHDQLVAQVEALQREVKRLNKELKKAQKSVLKIRISDDNFLKPLTEINKDYGNS